MNRCIICDYTLEEGSDFAGRAPHSSHIRDIQGDFLCDECAESSAENLEDLAVNDIDPDEVL